MYKNMSSSFYFENGKLFCENINIEDLFNSIPASTQEVEVNGQRIKVDVPNTPCFVYSSSALQRNVSNYLGAMKNSNINSRLGYAVKANGNQGILKSLKSHGVEMVVTVSGNEILAGLKAGFLPENIILNGNGKQEWEIKLGMQQGIILNVDSIFDGRRIVDIQRKYFPDKNVKVLLRIRPTVSVHSTNSSVHPYVNTAEASKFGFEMTELDEVLEILERGNIKIYGIHCHYGSCIYDPNVYRFMGETMASMATELQKRGCNIEILNVGGGIGINYHQSIPGVDLFLEKNEKVTPENSDPIDCTDFSEFSNTPNTSKFMEVISDVIPKNITIIVEPGRSLVANTGIIVCKVLGTKLAKKKQFIVVDASMAEIIRPCLYGSHHQIYPTTLKNGVEWLSYDVVGPICETADFIGQNILLQATSDYLAVMDSGAYCSSMSSNYNMRPRPAEIMVDGASWKYIRQRDTFEDLMVKN